MRKKKTHEEIREKKLGATLFFGLVSSFAAGFLIYINLPTTKKHASASDIFE